MATFAERLHLPVTKVDAVEEMMGRLKRKAIGAEFIECFKRFRHACSSLPQVLQAPAGLWALHMHAVHARCGCLRCTLHMHAVHACCGRLRCMLHIHASHARITCTLWALCWSQPAGHPQLPANPHDHIPSDFTSCSQLSAVLSGAESTGQAPSVQGQTGDRAGCQASIPGTRHALP
jgi:hypothetical protein